jgi:hypothetical protein
MAADVDDLGAWALEDLLELERPFEDPARSAASTLDADVVA